MSFLLLFYPILWLRHFYGPQPFAEMVLLGRLTRIVPPQSWVFMAMVDKGCATAGKYESVTNSFDRKGKRKRMYTNKTYKANWPDIKVVGIYILLE